MIIYLISQWQTIVLKFSRLTDILKAEYKSIARSLSDYPLSAFCKN